MEALQKSTGGCGRFQWLMVLSLKLGLVPFSWSMLQMTFGGMVTDWWCIPPPEASTNVSSSSSASSSSAGLLGNWSQNNVTYQACQIPGSGGGGGGGESCAGYMVFEDSVNTVVSEWSLVCEKKYIKALITSLQMAGVFVGALVAGYTCDTFGRRVTCYAALTWHLVTSLVAAFSVTWQMFLAMRILIGVSIGAYFVASFSFCFEFVSPQHRQMVSFTPAWNIGVMLFALCAWLMRDWSHLHITAAVLTAPILLTWFVIPESARWLATKGRLQEAERVLHHVARVNRRPPPPNAMPALQQVALQEQKAGQGQGQGQGRRYTYLDVYRGWTMARTTLILNFIWLSMAFCYYGISFGVSALSGNFYLNLFIMEIFPIPSGLTVVFISNKLGRRWTCSGLFILAAVASFGILVVEKTLSEWWKGTVTTVLAVVSRTAIDSAWMVAATMSSELYATVVRNLGYGTCNTVARIGGALAPVVLMMDTQSDVVRGYIIVGAVMAVCGVLTLILRETKGEGLQDSITVDRKDTSSDDVKTKGENGDSLQRSELSVWTVAEDSKKNGRKRENGSKYILREERKEEEGREMGNGKVKEREDEGKGQYGEKDGGMDSNNTDIFSVRL